MAYNYLIEKADFAEIRDISNNVDFDKRIKPYVREAQEFDIRPILGAEMFYDLLKNSADDNYTALLDGLDYTYADVNYSFVGLKTIIAYYTYARFIPHDNVRSTPSGMMGKTNEFSERISKSEIDRIVNQNQSAAYAYIEDMICFLDRKVSDYPKWNTTYKSEVKRKVNFSTIKKI